MDIYTIGHSNYPVERFIEILKTHAINCVVDIRGTPYSKYNIQFNKEVIMKTLRNNGFIYIYMGKEFAVQRRDKRLYTDEGYADFEKVINDDDFLYGIERIRNGLNKGYKIALMGAMQDPISCHRAILVGRELSKKGFTLKHILHENTIASQKELEEKILEKYFGDRGQITIDSLLGLELPKEEIIKEGYKKSNREIGYRVEKIKNKK